VVAWRQETFSREACVKNLALATIVLLCATSALAIDSHLFYMKMNPADCLCPGTDLTIGGQTYTARATGSGQLYGPTSGSFSQGMSVTAKLRWFSGSAGSSGAICGDTRDVCSGTITLQPGSGTVCSVGSGYDVRTLQYTIDAISSNGHAYWRFVFSTTYNGGDPVQ
jgi:hypothetical protein